MKKLVIAALMVCSMQAGAQLLTAGQVEYEKDNAIVSVKTNPSSINFSINSVVGQNTCELEGVAVMTAKDRYYYLPGKDEKQCEVLFVFDGDNNLKISTTNCERSCGLNAEGSMDGDYQKNGATPVASEQSVDADEFTCHAEITKQNLTRILFQDVGRQYGDDAMKDLLERLNPTFDLIVIQRHNHDTGALFCSARLAVTKSNINLKLMMDNAANQLASQELRPKKPSSFDENESAWNDFSYKIQPTSDGGDHVIEIEDGQGYIDWFKAIVKYGGLKNEAVKNSQPSQLPVSEVVKPSFDCAKASSANEKMICGDAELAGLDSELATAYKQAKASAKDPVAFKQQTVDAWKWREANCHDKACLVKWYEDRRESLAAGI